MPYMLMQDCLSTRGSLIICDGRARGFPILYASQGFAELFGYNAAECMGRKCGAIVGHGALVSSSEALAQLEEAATGAAQGLELLREHTAEEVQQMASSPAGERAGFAVLVNRKKTGELFTCELVTRMYNHPALGWPYCVGLQSDISDEVPFGELLAIAARGEYSAFMQSRAASKEAALSLLDSHEATRYLNDKAGETWKPLLDSMHPSSCSGAGGISGGLGGGAGPSSKQHKPSDKRSVASRSTAVSSGSGHTVSTISSARSEDTVALAQQMRALPTLKEAPEAEGGDQERFFDLLEAAEEVAPVLRRELRGPGKGLVVGSPSWRRVASVAPPEESDDESGPHISFGNTVQTCAEALSCKELNDLDFPFTISAPFLQGCPLVLCSAGFADLTGYHPSEALGQPGAGWDLLLRGAPASWIDATAQAECRKFCTVASEGGWDCDAERAVLSGGLAPEVRLALVLGELLCVQGQATSSGRLFRSVNLMKQTELEDAPFVVSLQVRLPDDHASAAVADEGGHVRAAFQRLQENLDSVEQVLTSQLWYSAPMRRQKACDAEDDFDGPSSGSGRSRCTGRK
jgi:PAS domain-containing protein